MAKEQEPEKPEEGKPEEITIEDKGTPEIIEILMFPENPENIESDESYEDFRPKFQEEQKEEETGHKRKLRDSDDRYRWKDHKNSYGKYPRDWKGRISV